MHALIGKLENQKTSTDAGEVICGENDRLLISVVLSIESFFEKEFCEEQASKEASKRR